MPKYRKKATLVTATIVDTPQYIATLEGVSEARVGDYLVTGTKGEQWFVKPDIFKKTYDKVVKSMNMNKAITSDLQKAIDQLSLDTVERQLPKDVVIHMCEIHGGFIARKDDTNPMCPLCHAYESTEPNTGNGTTATEMELLIDLKDSITPL